MNPKSSNQTKHFSLTHFSNNEPSKTNSLIFSLSHSCCAEIKIYASNRCVFMRGGGTREPGSPEIKMRLLKIVIFDVE